MMTQWREFEKLVAQVEQAMGPSGAEVKSPDRIPDNYSQFGESLQIQSTWPYNGLA